MEKNKKQKPEDQTPPVVSVELTTIQPTQITEVTKLKQKVLEVVAANPFIEVKDNKTYGKAKENRKNLRETRIEIEKQEKAIPGILSAFRKTVGYYLIGEDNPDALNKLAKTPEDKQDAEIKIYEEKLEAARIENARIAQEREDGIMLQINTAVDEINSNIDGMTYENHETEKTVIEHYIAERKGTFQEFDVHFDNALALIRERMQNKIDALKNGHIEAENNRVDGIKNFIQTTESWVKDGILKATFETIDDVTESIKQSLSPEYDFQEFAAHFDDVADELRGLWEKRKKELTDLHDMELFKAEKLLNSRGEILASIGMEKRENGDWFVHDLDYTKTSILADSENAFQQTLENIKRFIEGEKNKPEISNFERAIASVADNDQHDAGDEHTPIAGPQKDKNEIINELREIATPNPDADYIVQAEAYKAISTGFDVETPGENKPDFVKMAEEKLAGTHGGLGAFHDAVEHIQHENVVDHLLDPIKNLGTVKTTGELIELLMDQIVPADMPLAMETRVIMFEGKIGFVNANDIIDGMV